MFTHICLLNTLIITLHFCLFVISSLYPHTIVMNATTHRMNHYIEVWLSCIFEITLLVIHGGCSRVVRNNPWTYFNRIYTICSNSPLCIKTWCKSFFLCFFVSWNCFIFCNTDTVCIIIYANEESLISVTHFERIL